MYSTKELACIYAQLMDGQWGGEGWGGGGGGGGLGEVSGEGGQ